MKLSLLRRYVRQVVLQEMRWHQEEQEEIEKDAKRWAAEQDENDRVKSLDDEEFEASLEGMSDEEKSYFRSTRHADTTKRSERDQEQSYLRGSVVGGSTGRANVKEPVWLDKADASWKGTTR